MLLIACVDGCMAQRAHESAIRMPELSGIEMEMEMSLTLLARQIPITPESRVH